MLRLIAGLTRSLPLVILLILIAVVVYFVVSWRHSPAKAKETLIKLFLVLCIAITAFFGLASIYALVDSNNAVFELAISCAVVGLIGLIITLICRYVFRKHHPKYRFKTTSNAETVGGAYTVEDAPMRKGTMFWKIYDLLGMFRPKK